MNSRSAEFLDEVAASVGAALAALDRHEEVLAGQTEIDPDRDAGWRESLGRLEGNLSGWQSILGDMAEMVRVAQVGLETLDTDLKRSLDTFSAVRKHLQQS